MPLALASPFFRSMDLAAHGVEFVHPDAPFAQPLDGGRAVVLERSLAATAAGLDGDDGRAWRRLFGPLARAADELAPELLGPVVHVPRHPLLLARFGLPALRSAVGLARSRFDGEAARALFTGVAAHSMLRLDRPMSAAFGLVLGTLRATPSAGRWSAAGRSASRRRWPRSCVALGGEIVTGQRVELARGAAARRGRRCWTSRRDRSSAIAGDRLSGRVRRRATAFRYGPGVFKVDWALDGPVPWAAEGSRRAATLHLGGTMEEVAASEADVAAGRHPERPYVLFVQYAPWDPSRAPDGKAVGVGVLPRARGVDGGHDRADRGPGRALRARVSATGSWPGRRARRRRWRRTTRTTSAATSTAASRTSASWCSGRGRRSTRTASATGLYLCSSSAPPGGGVHGMSGLHAARSALRRDLA